MSEGDFGDMAWIFAEIIERFSYGINMRPVDLIGIGMVVITCFFELYETGKLNDPS